ncbi:hypothetical protein GGI59_002260 [Rhizobium lentis]|uniref:Antifreeze protein n=1 Tax=Rhizobium lentis TaxID=1138194 RepID=A0A7W8XF34_9HYPH|nr:hypothetical protein [Rhizobium lentis]MBB5550373.1 hypothetical protein [Rhizobium lentis]MBB5560598.1 hypothetical protein [Rhizobium lentis]MBB5567183.1 hypothetical protein [Rhizobium lentis]
MKMLFSSLAAIVLSASFALPLNATPIVVPKAVAMHTADVEQVHYRRHGHVMRMATGKNTDTLTATAGITARAIVRGITAVATITAIATTTPIAVGQV